MGVIGIAFKIICQAFEIHINIMPSLVSEILPPLNFFIESYNPSYWRTAYKRSKSALNQVENRKCRIHVGIHHFQLGLN